jgi:hypothetical protein
MREQYGIEGSGFVDILGALCLPCCGLIQEEKEARLHAQREPAIQGYQQNPEMSLPLDANRGQ